MNYHYYSENFDFKLFYHSFKSLGNVHILECSHRKIDLFQVYVRDQFRVQNLKQFRPCLKQFYSFFKTIPSVFETILVIKLLGPSFRNNLAGLMTAFGSVPNNDKQTPPRVPNFLHDFFSLKCSLGSKTPVKKVIRHVPLRGRGQGTE